MPSIFSEVKVRLTLKRWKISQTTHKEENLEPSEEIYRGEFLVFVHRFVFVWTGWRKKSEPFAHQRGLWEGSISWNCFESQKSANISKNKYFVGEIKLKLIACCSGVILKFDTVYKLYLWAAAKRDQLLNCSQRPCDDLKKINTDGIWKQLGGKVGLWRCWMCLWRYKIAEKSPYQTPQKRNKELLSKCLKFLKLLKRVSIYRVSFFIVCTCESLCRAIESSSRRNIVYLFAYLLVFLHQYL